MGMVVLVISFGIAVGQITEWAKERRRERELWERTHPEGGAEYSGRGEVPA
jgi:hypothetical protein